MTSIRESAVLDAVEAARALSMHSQTISIAVSFDDEPTLILPAPEDRGRRLAVASSIAGRMLRSPFGRIVRGECRRALVRTAATGNAEALLRDALMVSGASGFDLDLDVACRNSGRDLAEALGDAFLARRVVIAADWPLEGAEAAFRRVSAPVVLEAVGGTETGFEKLADFFGLSAMERLDILTEAS